VNITIKLPDAIGERFLPTDNKSAFIREAITEKLDRRDSQDGPAMDRLKSQCRIWGVESPRMSELVDLWIRSKR